MNVVLRNYDWKVVGVLLCLFGGYGALNSRDSLVIRPHPMVWRCLHHFGLVHLLCPGTLRTPGPGSMEGSAFGRESPRSALIGA